MVKKNKEKQKGPKYEMLTCFQIEVEDREK